MIRAPRYTRLCVLSILPAGGASVSGRRRRGVVAMAVLLAVVAAVSPRALQRDTRGVWMGVLDEHPAIAWATRPTTDAVAALNQRLERGEATLTFEPGSGYLRSVLAALDVPAASQMLVLSRTGVQRLVTSPANPRALFYNEQVSVGFIRRSPFLELIAHDPEQGAVFYTLDQRPAERPAFSRQGGCVTCHVASATLEVPGFMTRSLSAGTDGTLKLRLGSHDLIDHRTPFERRWGGWFVTGRHGTSSHQGNTVVDANDARRSLVPAGALNAASLDGAVDLAGYPAATSDVAALAVFDHQTRALNLITRLGWEVRVAAHEGRVPLETPAVNATLGDLVDYLLFVGEAPMPGGLRGSSGFAEWFSARGPKDAQGRTLHALDLTTRLMRYPLSYTIDSAAFDALPDDIRAEVYRGLARVLVAGDAAPKYAHLTPADRRAVVEILRETRPDARAHLAAPR
jgi:hypothetical protein